MVNHPNRSKQAALTAREMDTICAALRLYRESIGHSMPEYVMGIEYKVAELQRRAAYKEANAAHPLPISGRRI